MILFIITLPSIISFPSRELLVSSISTTSWNIKPWHSISIPLPSPFIGPLFAKSTATTIFCAFSHKRAIWSPNYHNLFILLEVSKISVSPRPSIEQHYSELCHLRNGNHYTMIPFVLIDEFQFFNLLLLLQVLHNRCLQICFQHFCLLCHYGVHGFGIHNIPLLLLIYLFLLILSNLFFLLLPSIHKILHCLHLLMVWVHTLVDLGKIILQFLHPIVLGLIPRLYILHHLMNRFHEKNNFPNNYPKLRNLLSLLQLLKLFYGQLTSYQFLALLFRHWIPQSRVFPRILSKKVLWFSSLLCGEPLSFMGNNIWRFFRLLHFSIKFKIFVWIKRIILNNK